MIKYFSKQIAVPWTRSLFTFVFFLSVAAAGSALGQNHDTRNKNNPYSPSPNPRAKQIDPPGIAASVRSDSTDVSFVMKRQNTPPTIAQSTFKIARNADLRSRPLTEIYKIGVGDVLFVNLKNSAHGSGYYTVRTDGTIDFPLAGENVIVADQTVEIIEEILTSGITLFQNPQIEVKVRQYSSHPVRVSGLVENGGEKNLQREAIPMYVIRAEAGVSSKATKALVTRAPLLKIETYDLGDSKTDDVLIFPGNSVEFLRDDASNNAHVGFYFITGEAVNSGQKELTPGLTLYQAVIASGGAKGDPKKAIVRRKIENGKFSNIEHNLRSIRNGKSTDPALVPGDVIEIRN